MVYAAILAGGTGKRLGHTGIPKQFIDIGGIPVLVMTLRNFLKSSSIDMVYIAVHPEWMDYCRQMLCAYFSHEELSRVQSVRGGKDRLSSLENILWSIPPCEDNILICHDAVRPFVSLQMIDDCIAAVKENDFALTVTPASDTAFISSDGVFLDASTDREHLYNGQTPSGFRVTKLIEILSRCSSDDKACSTGTMQLVLQAGYKIRLVKGSERNFKITTPHDLELARKLALVFPQRPSVKLLDCTLRDGGIPLDFRFGKNRMQRIKSALESAHVDYMECGYIDDRKGTFNGSRFCGEAAVKENFLFSGKRFGVTYLAMIDYGRFDVSRLYPASPNGIDGIRLAFHKEDWKNALDCGRMILSKGYQLFLQPMVCLRYDEREFRNLITNCNEELPDTSCFYIVDSFGQMDSRSVMNRMELLNVCLLPSISIGFHAHNNRQLAFSNAIAFLQANTVHPLVIDACIMGMGRGAGNLCTELIIPELNALDGHYDVTPLYHEIATDFNELHKDYPWGYNLKYYLSSVYGCSPSYIGIFSKDRRVTIDILIDLLKEMPTEKRSSCDRAFAEEYLRGYLKNV